MIEVDGIEYGTPSEVAAALGVSYATVRDWILHGHLAAVKDGRRNYVRLDQAAAVELATRQRGRPRSAV